MALAVKENEPSNPVRIGLFGSKAIMFSPNDFSDSIQEFRIARRWNGGYGGGHALHPADPVWKGKRITRSDYPAVANKKPNNAAYFSLN